MVADIGPIVDDRQFFAVQATTKIGSTLGVKLYRVTERAGLDDAVEVSGSGLGIASEKPSPCGSMRTDGFSDLAIGAPGAEVDGLFPGAVYVFLSPVDPVMTTEDADLMVLETPTRQSSAPLSGHRATWTVMADKVDRGVAWIIGWRGHGPDHRHRGTEGAVSAEAAAWGTLTGAAGRRARVHASADVDGDGHPDAIVGAPEAAGSGVDAGAVYLVWGGAGTGVFAPDASIEAVAPHVGLGAALGVTRSGPSGEFQALLVGGDGADLDDAGDEEDQTGALWMFGFEG